MRKNALVWLLAGACVVCWDSANATQPEQQAQGSAPKDAVESRSAIRNEPVKSTKTVILARNVNAKAGASASTTTAKPLTAEEKKAVSRCWKRLMNMVREANHAHRAKN